MRKELSVAKKAYKESLRSAWSSWTATKLTPLVMSWR